NHLRAELPSNLPAQALLKVTEGFRRQVVAHQPEKKPPLVRIESFEQLGDIGRMLILYDGIDTFDITRGQRFFHLLEEGLAQARQLSFVGAKSLARLHAESFSGSSPGIGRHCARL